VKSIVTIQHVCNPICSRLTVKPLYPSLSCIIMLTVEFPYLLELESNPLGLLDRKQFNFVSIKILRYQNVRMHCLKFHSLIKMKRNS